MSDTSLTAINLHAGKLLLLVSTNRSGKGNSSFPCTLFEKGYTILTQLSGDGEVGELFFLFYY